VTVELRGIIPALTTPFAAGSIAADRLRRNVDSYDHAGLAGYLVLGSTGEAVLLDEGERRGLLEAARTAIPRGKPMIAGVTAESTVEARKQVEVAAGCGADFALVGTPHYFRDQMTRDALTAHYLEIADGSPIPLLLYNVPKFTGLALPLEVVAEVGRHENVAGLKESSGDRAYLRAALGCAGDDFRILCGASARVGEALAAGATGAILAVACFLPEPFVEIARTTWSGDTSAAEALQRAVDDSVAKVAGEYGVPGIKAAMDLRGLYGGPPRSPLRPVSRDVRRGIEAQIDALVDLGLIGGRELPRG
jgi:4-hydroxy-2-oxoglutarate aldolase